MKASFVVVVAAVLCGCTTYSPVASIEPGVYTLSAGNVSTWRSRSQMRDKAAQRATDFCATQHKVAHMENSLETGASIVTPLQSTIVFRCVAELSKN